MNLAACALLLASVALAYGNDFAFTPTGSLKHLEYFQQRVVDNAEEASAFAFVFENNSVLVSVRKHDHLVDYEAECVIRKSPVLSAVVGWNADCSAARRLIQEISTSYMSEFHERISVSKLALELADDAHARSLSGATRPLAYNALLLGYSSSSAPNIYKIDVSGNYWKCQAASVGRHSQEVSGWIRSKGLEMVSDCVASFKSSGASVSQLQADAFCMNFTWSCLCDVLGPKLSKYTVEIALQSVGRLRGPHRFFARDTAPGKILPSLFPPPIDAARSASTHEEESVNGSSVSLWDVWCAKTQVTQGNPSDSAAPVSEDSSSIPR